MSHVHGFTPHNIDVPKAHFDPPATQILWLTLGNVRGATQGFLGQYCPKIWISVVRFRFFVAGSCFVDRDVRNHSADCGNIVPTILKIESASINSPNELT